MLRDVEILQLFGQQLLGWRGRSDFARGNIARRGIPRSQGILIDTFQLAQVGAGIVFLFERLARALPQIRKAN